MNKISSDYILKGRFDRVALVVTYFSLCMAPIPAILALLFLQGKDRSGLFALTLVLFGATLVRTLWQIKHTLIISPINKSVTIYRKNFLGISYKPSFIKLDEVTKFMTNLQGVGEGSGVFVEFTFCRSDGASITFRTYQPDFLIKPRFWSTGSLGTYAKNKEQDVIAPEIARTFHLPLETYFKGTLRPLDDGR